MHRATARSLWVFGAVALSVACGGRDEPRFGFDGAAAAPGEGGHLGDGGSVSSGGAGFGGTGRSSSGTGAAQGGSAATSTASVSATGVGGVASTGVGGDAGGGAVGGLAGRGGAASTGVGGDAGGGAVGGLAGQGGVAGAAGSSSGGTGGVGQCVAQAENRCGVCACTHCFDELGACIADFGCPLILQCIERTGCTGIGCYQPSTCRSVIDSFGGLVGVSMRRAIVLGVCSFGADCPC